MCVCVVGCKKAAHGGVASQIQHHQQGEKERVQGIETIGQDGEGEENKRDRRWSEAKA